uniref:Precursor A n=2 Tax=Actinoalloteichus fjordicus TaxID=1612552 RepID=A0A1V0D998_9PSEU|nr:precursor A [Actinoalloteichus fjordicus]
MSSGLKGYRSGLKEENLMNREPMVTESLGSYEPPALEEVGIFDEVTLGRPSWGFEADWSCVMVC